MKTLLDQPIVILDTETTASPDNRKARAWEVAALHFVPGNYPVTPEGFTELAEVGESALLLYTQLCDLDMGHADGIALAMNGFYERHPQMVDDEVGSSTVDSELEVLEIIESFTRGATLAGSNPWFDMDVLGRRMRAVGIKPSWHYHPLDVPTLAQGWLRGRVGVHEIPTKSDEISRKLSVDPDAFGRHSAVGDVLWMDALLRRIVIGE